MKSLFKVERITLFKVIFTFLAAIGTVLVGIFAILPVGDGGKVAFVFWTIFLTGYFVIAGIILLREFLSCKNNLKNAKKNMGMKILLMILKNPH